MKTVERRLSLKGTFELGYVHWRVVGCPLGATAWSSARFALEDVRKDALTGYFEGDSHFGSDEEVLPWD